MVQTFVVDDTKSLIHDVEQIDEWRAKCESLGLTKQLDLASEEKSPIPFEYMNETAKRVYEVLCPRKVDLDRYDKTPIPVEILGLLQLSKNEKYFDKIQIWYDDKSPDPLAIGFKMKDSYEWNADKYLIGRWGDVLRPFEELKEKAIKIFTESRRISLTREISQKKQELETIDVDVAAHFDVQATLSVPSPTFF